jgi:lysophospholipase L1-like esterase
MKSGFTLLLTLLLAGPLAISQAERKEPANIKYLALGDSYTIGTAIGKENSYASLLADSLNKWAKVDLEIIAENGWTTAELLDAIARAQPDNAYNLVTLMIGVNNQYDKRPLEEYQKELKLLLLKALTLTQNNKNNVAVLSIPDWGSTPAGKKNRPAISKEIDRFNSVGQQLCDSLEIPYYHITTISRQALHQPELIASDSLHFSAAMHQFWLRAIFPSIAKQVQKGLK